MGQGKGPGALAFFTLCCPPVTDGQATVPRSRKKEACPDQESHYLRLTFPRASVLPGLGKGSAGRGPGEGAKGFPRG